MATGNSTTRFSDRAYNYDLYRPGYPPAIVPWLEQTIGINNSSCIADIGSGTGIFSSLFLAAGYVVKAVEPNAGMRSMAVKNLAHHHGFESIDGTAAHTGLPGNAVELIAVAQAFHWFQLPEVKKEFRRILRQGAHVLLVWNILQTDTPFLQAYHALKEKYAEKNAHPDHGNLDGIRHFFYPAPVVTHQLNNIQMRDAAGLKGLLSSSSKIPLPGDQQYGTMIKELDTLCAQYAENGLLTVAYQTNLYLVKMA